MEEHADIGSLPSSVAFWATAGSTLPSPDKEEVVVQLDHF